jgi:hypothetical protein
MGDDEGGRLIGANPQHSLCLARQGSRANPEVTAASPVLYGCQQGSKKEGPLQPPRHSATPSAHGGYWFFLLLSPGCSPTPSPALCVFFFFKPFLFLQINAALICLVYK